MCLLLASALVSSPRWLRRRRSREEEQDEGEDTGAGLEQGYP